MTTVDFGVAGKARKFAFWKTHIDHLLLLQKETKLKILISRLALSLYFPVWHFLGVLQLDYASYLIVNYLIVNFINKRHLCVF